MIINKDTLEIGGVITIPGSFQSPNTPGEIIGKTKVGINVVYYKGTDKEMKAFFAYSWLQQEYGDKFSCASMCDTSGLADDLNDAIPF